MRDVEPTRCGGASVLFVMAAEAEYGPHLQRRFRPLITGVGPVEAAVGLSAMLSRLEARDALPDLVVSLGSAGSRTLEQTEVYQANSVSYRDMDASALGFERGVTPFLDLPAVLPMPLRIPDISEASLSTGGNVVSGAAYEAISADMVDMETYAVLRACHHFDLPTIGLRRAGGTAPRERLDRISPCRRREAGCGGGPARGGALGRASALTGGRQHHAAAMASISASSARSTGMPSRSNS